MLLSGIINNRYEIIGNYKSGGMSVIYLVRDLNTSKECVLKQMNMNGNSLDVELEKMFKREVQLLAQLNYPAIPGIIDYFEYNDQHCLVMDRVQGKDLKELRFEREFGSAEIFSIAIELLEILKYLHNQNPQIIFRDLKPSNVMLDQNNHVRLIDFGIARRVFDFQSGDTKTRIGTDGYAPVEQYMGKPDTRSDLFSLGALMYFLVTGKDPEPMNPVPVEKIVENIDEKLKMIINRAMETNTSKRYQTAEEMLNEISPIGKQDLMVCVDGEISDKFLLAQFQQGVVDMENTQSMIKLIENREKELADYNELRDFIDQMKGFGKHTNLMKNVNKKIEKMIKNLFVPNSFDGIKIIIRENEYVDGLEMTGFVYYLSGLANMIRGNNKLANADFEKAIGLNPRIQNLYSTMSYNKELIKKKWVDKLSTVFVAILITGIISFCFWVTFLMNPK